MSVPTRGLLKLYVTTDCCLCDEAVDVLAQAHAPDFECVGIDGDAMLEARYGARVPVLFAVADGRELDWPFDAAAVTAFLGRG
ncbi:MAG TPA: glutaredoxin family protein [Dokdonella sp.]|uniref:glutaredoxin family protein n=1 Tax=Dokdonella sp. TaxID=2291710 RepID=UPI0025C1C6F4|nr:glutaredoxin family protein [Dokdonella sp.]MBX3690905.1 glutaredoxin family protein [Dokdonella sp.]MCW5567280.1 glutaredoxin family protein [Dokdonella sp.]HNR92003.1 glutaredoxin family protein [Dokdonella sp.]